MRRRIAFINSDGTVNNIVVLEDISLIAENPDWRDLRFFDYTDWAPEDHPRTTWTYNLENESWNKTEPPTVPVPEGLVPLEAAAVDELLGGN
jgi:hypothetical protein